MEYSAGYADIGIAGTMPRSGLCRVQACLSRLTAE
jgi:hypothetical protein